MSSSSSSSENGAEEEAVQRREVGVFEGPSSSRQRSMNDVWPEPFVESLACHVAIDAARSSGRLAAAPAIANVFQVCSTWRAISRSDNLWQNLTRQIWNRHDLQHDTWHDEYVHRHRTTYNFHTRRAVYTTLEFDTFGNEDADSLACRCLALSDTHLACGFLDGTVRLFELTTRLHVNTFQPQQRDRLGRFSQAVSGLVLTDSRVVFASIDGDVHVAVIQGEGARRVQFGHVVNDGTLVDFTGCDQFWVGLFAGVPGRAFHVWNGQTEQLIFVGGSLTDPEAVMGWHLLTELSDSIGRIRITNQESVVACTSVRVMVFDLNNRIIVSDQERDIMVNTMDVSNRNVLLVDNRRHASVNVVDGFDELSRFRIRSRSGGAPRGGVLGCMNSGYVFICTGGVIRVWDVHHGVYLYSLRERIGEGVAMVVNDRYLAASSSETTIHLWDFGALL